MKSKKIIVSIIIFLIMFTALASINFSKANVGMTEFTLKLTQTRHSQIGWTPRYNAYNI